MANPVQRERNIREIQTKEFSEDDVDLLTVLCVKNAEDARKEEEDQERERKRIKKKELQRMQPPKVTRGVSFGPLVQPAPPPAPPAPPM